jgi:lysine 2,3-aminomutase
MKYIREKRDELKENKFLSQLQKSTGSGDQDKAPAGNE